LKDDEILTVDELAALLKATKTQVYEIARKRYERRHGFALRKFYVGNELRFRLSDIEEWIEKSVQDKA
ncbi:MAG TPA: helix-turn-helix domain-containing protein, partial [Candidatus Acidoferrales bacterium]|nr:helix-turn-helix domain-containing protein [Candidatus Acidoferrales bacterium]